MTQDSAVIDLLSRLLNMRPVDPAARLRDDLGIDSLALVRVLQQLEIHTGHPQLMTEGITAQTVGDLLTLIAGPTDTTSPAC